MYDVIRYVVGQQQVLAGTIFPNWVAVCRGDGESGTDVVFLRGVFDKACGWLDYTNYTAIAAASVQRNITLLTSGGGNIAELLKYRAEQAKAKLTGETLEAPRQKHVLISDGLTGAQQSIKADGSPAAAGEEPVICIVSDEPHLTTNLAQKDITWCKLFGVAYFELRTKEQVLAAVDAMPRGLYDYLCASVPAITQADVPLPDSERSLLMAQKHFPPCFPHHVQQRTSGVSESWHYAIKGARQVPFIAELFKKILSADELRLSAAYGKCRSRAEAGTPFNAKATKILAARAVGVDAKSVSAIELPPVHRQTAALSLFDKVWSVSIKVAAPAGGASTYTHVIGALKKPDPWTGRLTQCSCGKDLCLAFAMVKQGRTRPNLTPEDLPTHFSDTLVHDLEVLSVVDLTPHAHNGRARIATESESLSGFPMVTVYSGSRHGKARDGPTSKKSGGHASNSKLNNLHRSNDSKKELPKSEVDSWLVPLQEEAAELAVKLNTCSHCNRPGHYVVSCNEFSSAQKNWQEQRALATAIAKVKMASQPSVPVAPPPTGAESEVVAVGTMAVSILVMATKPDGSALPPPMLQEFVKYRQQLETGMAAFGNGLVPERADSLKAQLVSLLDDPLLPKVVVMVGMMSGVEQNTSQPAATVDGAEAFVRRHGKTWLKAAAAVAAGNAMTPVQVPTFRQIMHLVSTSVVFALSRPKPSRPQSPHATMALRARALYNAIDQTAASVIVLEQIAVAAANVLFYADVKPLLAFELPAPTAPDSPDCVAVCANPPAGGGPCSRVHDALLALGYVQGDAASVPPTASKLDSLQAQLTSVFAIAVVFATKGDTGALHAALNANYPGPYATEVFRILSQGWSGGPDKPYVLKVSTVGGQPIMAANPGGDSALSFKTLATFYGSVSIPSEHAWTVGRFPNETRKAKGSVGSKATKATKTNQSNQSARKCYACSCPCPPGKPGVFRMIPDRLRVTVGMAVVPTNSVVQFFRGVCTKCLANQPTEPRLQYVRQAMLGSPPAWPITSVLATNGTSPLVLGAISDAATGSKPHVVIAHATATPRNSVLNGFANGAGRFPRKVGDGKGFGVMAVKVLRPLASSLNLSTTGTKQEVAGRLQAELEARKVAAGTICTHDTVAAAVCAHAVAFYLKDVAAEGFTLQYLAPLIEHNAIDIDSKGESKLRDEYVEKFGPFPPTPELGEQQRAAISHLEGVLRYGFAENETLLYGVAGANDAIIAAMLQNCEQLILNQVGRVQNTVHRGPDATELRRRIYGEDQNRNANADVELVDADYGSSDDHYVGYPPHPVINEEEGPEELRKRCASLTAEAHNGVHPLKLEFLSPTGRTNALRMLRHLDLCPSDELWQCVADCVLMTLDPSVVPKPEQTEAEWMTELLAIERAILWWDAVQKLKPLEAEWSEWSKELVDIKRAIWWGAPADKPRRIVCRSRRVAIWTTMLSGCRARNNNTLPHLPEELWLLLFGFLKHDEPAVIEGAIEGAILDTAGAGAGAGAGADILRPLPPPSSLGNGEEVRAEEVRLAEEVRAEEVRLADVRPRRAKNPHLFAATAAAAFRDRTGYSRLVWVTTAGSSWPALIAEDQSKGARELVGDRCCVTYFDEPSQQRVVNVTALKEWGAVDKVTALSAQDGANGTQQHIFNDAVARAGAWMAARNS